MSQLRATFEQFGPNSAYLQELYDEYLLDPSRVSESWARYFYELEQAAALNGGARALPAPETNGHGSGGHSAGTQIIEAPSARAPQGSPSERTSSHGSYIAPAADAEVQERIYRMISAFRNRGHLRAAINPLSQGVASLPATADTEIGFYQFTEEQLAGTYACAGFGDHEYLPLRDLIDQLQQVYCSSIGFEFTHIMTQEERSWLQNRIENRFEEGYRLSPEARIRRLRNIISAETFEEELHKKYIGSKRFSLQGAETSIPMLKTLLDTAGEEGLRSAVLGMAHRGRLNVLVNLFGKPLEAVFTEFEDTNIANQVGSGDVKYHLGFHSDYRTPHGPDIDLRLAPNPSHLEFVNPVVEGMVRALQDLEFESNRETVLPVLLHGDAAFIGQGVVAETFNFANVTGYDTGGTVHIVINNQIGFTTDPEESRSSIYCTDMAKAIQAPVFHVNAEDVEGACWLMRTALEFRNRYGRDVIVDLYCYRKYGHNEGDDPSFTQPVIYEEIRRKPTIATIYGKTLIEEGTTTEEDVKSFKDHYKQKFAEAQDRKAEIIPGPACALHGRLLEPSPETGVELRVLERVASAMITHPESFTPHTKLQRILEKRVNTLHEDTGIEWGLAEGLAFGSLLFEGVSIRLSGQDCGRGTFSQRHLELTDNESGERYFPLQKLTQSAVFEVFNSTLSEAAVMGFEFGYSSLAHDSLVMWEGQFGDFANGAQVIIDQFLSASEAKWNQRSGLVLLLPHGYEGQGPEHSSARLERYLQLCAEGNMTVCYPSSAEQYFHMLRRQGLSEIKRPLVVMTPKSLLRNPEACSARDNFIAGKFDFIQSEQACEKDAVEHVFFMSGKIVYEARKALEESDFSNYEVVRVEQLYPFPEDPIEKVFETYPNAKFAYWVQEEPQNMGAWNYMRAEFFDSLGVTMNYIGRPASASTAAGSPGRHAEEQESILERVVAFCSGEVEPKNQVR